MRVIIAMVAVCAATAAVADERDPYAWLDMFKPDPVQRRIEESERRMLREMDNRAAQQELERRMDSIFYPTPRESCINWAIDCGRAAGVGR